MIIFKPDDSSVISTGSKQSESAVIKAFDGEKCIGSCAVFIDGYKCSIHDIKTEFIDGLLVEGLIRSTLNYAANRGAYIADCDDESNKNILQFLGFKLNDGVYTGEIPELLKGSCCKG